MQEDHYSNLIVKFFVDELNEKERRELMDWITHSKENYELFQSYEKIFDQSSLYERNYDTQKAFKQVQERITAAQKPLPAQRSRRAVLQYAFSALLPILMLLMPLLVNRPTNETPAPLFNAALLEMRHYHNPAGKRATVVLPDSSRVTLNGGSSLFFPKQFGAANRLVTLRGEGFFEVLKDNQRPFEVQTDGLTTRVLGTSFNIKAYEEDELFSVAVLTGRVQVTEASTTPFTEGKLLADLTADQSLLVNAGEVVTNSRPTNSLVGWLENRLIFNNASLAEIARELERMYNTKTTFSNDQIKNRRYSAQFKPRTPLSEVMRTLAAAEHFKYQLSGNTIAFQ